METELCSLPGRNKGNIHGAEKSQEVEASSAAPHAHQPLGILMRSLFL